MSRAGGRSRPVFARCYQRLSVLLEAEGFAAYRDELLQDLHGRVLEVGAGNGLNFAHYPDTVSEVLAVEPEPHLRAAAEHAARSARTRIAVTDGVAAALPVSDGSMDAVVVSLVLCSVPDQGAALAEIVRVLRPGGAVRLVEHVRSDHRFGAAAQRAVDVLWPYFGGGCHTGRDTMAAVRAAGLVVTAERSFPFPHTRIPTPTRPHVLAVGHKPAPGGASRIGRA